MHDLSTIEFPPLEFLSREVIQAIESYEFEEYNNAFTIMEKAGKALADEIREITTTGSNLLFCLGPGNNGGDGYIAIRELQKEYSITIVRIHSPKTELAKRAADEIDVNNVNIVSFENTSTYVDLLKNSDLIIDSVFGIGIKSNVRKPYDAIIEPFQQYEDKILSVDLPSGLDCNEEKWWGPKFYPNWIITMAYTKKVMKSYNEKSIIITKNIGFHLDSQYVTNHRLVDHLWIKRRDDSHKGQNGRVMVIGGSDEFTGAPVLSGMAVLKSGVDTLRIAVPETIRDIVAGYNQDFIVVKTKGERHNSKSFKKFRNLTKNRHDVVVMGMGLSNHNDTKKFVRELVPELKDSVKIVLDADAIRPFRDHLDLLKSTPVILTPHKAELRFLLKSQLPSDFSQLVQSIKETALEFNSIILLKGKVDIITDGKRVLLNNTGTAAMTVGGTGDVLAGVVAAVNCFIEDSFYATAIATYIMGLAGEKTTEKYGIGLMASDIVNELPKILLEFDLI